MINRLLSRTLICTLFVLGTGARGLSEDFTVSSNVTGIVDITLGGDTTATWLQGTSEQTFVEISNIEDSLSETRRWIIEGSGNVVVSTDNGVSFNPSRETFGRFILNLIWKILRFTLGEPLVFGSPFSANSALIRQDVGVSGSLIYGIINDSLLLGFDGFYNHISGYEVYPDSVLNFIYPIRRVEQSVNYHADGTLSGNSIVHVNTVDRGLIQIPISITGTYISSNSRIQLPATIEGEFSMTSYNVLTGDWIGEGQVVAKKYNGNSTNVMTMHHWGILTLLVLLVLSGVTFFVVRRRRIVTV